MKPSSQITGSDKISDVIGQIHSIGTSFSCSCKLSNKDFRPFDRCESRVKLPVRSQICTYLSFDPEANIVESIFIATVLTYLACSANVLRQFPCKSQILTNRSSDPEARNVPVVLNLTVVTDEPCAKIVLTHSQFIELVGYIVDVPE